MFLLEVSNEQLVFNWAFSSIIFNIHLVCSKVYKWGWEHLQELSLSCKSLTRCSPYSKVLRCFCALLFLSHKSKKTNSYQEFGCSKMFQKCALGETHSMKVFSFPLYIHFSHHSTDIFWEPAFFQALCRDRSNFCPQGLSVQWADGLIHKAIYTETLRNSAYKDDTNVLKTSQIFSELLLTITMLCRESK